MTDPATQHPAPEIQMVAALPEGRPETGPMQFGDDWPGVFIRGDNALAFSHAIIITLDRASKGDLLDYLSVAMLRGLGETLASCRNRQRPADEDQEKP